MAAATIDELERCPASGLGTGTSWHPSRMNIWSPRRASWLVVTAAMRDSGCVRHRRGCHAVNHCGARSSARVCWPG